MVIKNVKRQNNSKSSQISSMGRGVFFYYYYNKNKTRERKGGLAVDFLVYKFSDLNSEIIPLFETYSILGVKFSEFNDFCSVVTLKNNSAHTLFFY